MQTVTDTSNSLKEEKNTSLKNLIQLVCFAIALIPILNMFWIITTVGCDNVSNDYLTYAHLLDKILSGQYDLGHLISDTFYRGHATTLAFLVHLGSAAWFSGSIMPELYLGFGLALARLYFWYDAIIISIGKTNAKNTYWLLPILSFFIFSNSQISLFSYPGATLPIGISLFGQALGIWALARFGPGWKGVAVAGAGGLISSYSWGIGPITWFLLLSYYLILKQYNWKKFLLLFSCAVISAIPYVSSLFVKGDNTGAVELNKTIISLFNLKVIVSLLGWPLANDIASHTGNLKEANFAGVFAIVFACALMAILIMHRKSFTLRQITVPVLLLLSGFLSVWEISMVRALLAPWYAALAIPFWCGLFALVALFFTKFTGVKELKSRVALKVCMLAMVLAIACYAKTNRTWDDKTYLLKGRAPASVSALYHAETAPTFADQYVFLWTPGSPSLLQKLAEVLQRHNMSVFGPSKRIWLQGDYMLNSVSVKSKNSGEAPYFTMDAKEKVRADWRDYNKLNLVLPAGSSLSWQFNIPANLKSGSLNTNLIAEDNSSSVNDVLLQVKRNSEAKQSLHAKALYAKHFKIDLLPYQGSKVEFEFINQESTPIVFREPYVFLNERAAKANSTAFNWLPDNTKYGATIKEFNPESDIALDVKDPAAWKATNAQATSSDQGDLKVVSSSNDATIAHIKDIDIPVRNGSNILFKVAAATAMKMRLLKVALEVSDQGYVTFNLPLLGSDTLQEYSYPVRLLNLKEDNIIKNLSIKTVDPNTDIEISSIVFQSAKP